MANASSLYGVPSAGAVRASARQNTASRSNARLLLRSVAVGGMGRCGASARTTGGEGARETRMPVPMVCVARAAGGYAVEARQRGASVGIGGISGGVTRSA